MDESPIFSLKIEQNHSSLITKFITDLMNTLLFVDHVVYPGTPYLARPSREGTKGDACFVPRAFERWFFGLLYYDYVVV